MAFRRSPVRSRSGPPSFARLRRATDGKPASSTSGDGSRRLLWRRPLLFVLLPFVILAGVLWLIAALVLLLVVWLTWCSRGRYALVVYSNSPIWHDYFE